MTHVTCRLTTKNQDQLRNPTLVIEYGLPLLYFVVDSEVGAACATGDGDEIMKHCPCYRVVQLMSSEPSLSPTDACTRVIRDICDRGRRRGQATFELGLIALNVKVFEQVATVVIYTHTRTHTRLTALFPGLPG